MFDAVKEAPITVNTDVIPFEVITGNAFSDMVTTALEGSVLSVAPSSDMPCRATIDSVNVFACA